MKIEGCKEIVVYMCGHILPEKSPILSPVLIPLSGSVYVGDSWKDVQGGGYGFTMAISS